MSNPNYASSRMYATAGENCLITRNEHDLVAVKGAVAANVVWQEGRPVDINGSGVATALAAPWTVSGSFALAKTDVDTTGATGNTEFMFVRSGPFVSERVIAGALSISVPLPAALVTAITAAGLKLDTGTIAQ